MSTVRPAWPWAWWWPWRPSLAPQLLSVLCWLLPACLACLPSRCTRRRVASWWRSLRAPLCLGLVLAWSGAALSGEVLYSRAARGADSLVQAVADMRLAARVFPLSYQIRKGGAELLMLVRPDADRGLIRAVLREALAGDPWSADLMMNLAVFTVLDGDEREAERLLRAAGRAARGSVEIRDKLRRLDGETKLSGGR